MKLRNTFLGLGAVALLASPLALTSPANAQVTQQGAGYLMRIKWEKNKSYAFNLNIAVNMGGPNAKPMQMKSPMSMKVASVANGVATLDVTITPPAAGSQPATPRKSQVKVDNRGRTVGGDQNMSLLIGLPEGPVRVGGTWKDSFNARNQMNAPMKVTASYTLKAIKTVGGRRVAEISTSNTGSGSGMSSSGSGTYTVDLADGMLVSGNIRQTVTMVTQTGQGGAPQRNTIPTTITISRA
jgi:hypothetical protein